MSRVEVVKAVRGEVTEFELRVRLGAVKVVKVDVVEMKGAKESRMEVVEVKVKLGEVQEEVVVKEMRL